ncbi:FAD dependent oxidoreductase [Penicillium longicatenatum]|nr:FAD dependent oxidoreductase [Penicillium longicatenatum]
MSTVIIGGGIIGVSVAYYLSASKPEGEIHIIEQSPELFNSASGYAGGFLARDWFEPALNSLGALSFNLHHQLAAEHGGDKEWGFMKGTAFNLDTVSNQGCGGARGDDWVHEDTSRAGTAAAICPIPAEWPAWLTKQQGGILERISEGETVAQRPAEAVPLSYQWSYLARCESSQPIKATKVTKDGNGVITGIEIVDLKSKKEYEIPCSNLVLSVGAWTPQVIRELFPSNKTSFDLLPLAGYSLVVRSPRHTLDHEKITHGGRSHAIFTTHPPSCGFSPEIFTREGGKIYIAGYNPHLKLPSCVEDIYALRDPAEMQKLKDVAVRLMGDLPKESSGSTGDVTNMDDLEILREGLCFRPVGEDDIPTVGRIRDAYLGGGLRSSATGGVYIATGHGPWGISLSLGTGKVVSEMIVGQRTSADVSGLQLR